MYRIGIDLGGTNIKAAILDKNNQILVSDTRPTRAGEGFEAVMNSIGESIARMTADLKELPGTEEGAQFCGGMTVPGQIYGPEGPVLYAPNLNWHDVFGNTQVFRSLWAMMPTASPLPKRSSAQARTTIPS